MVAGPAFAGRARHGIYLAFGQTQGLELNVSVTLFTTYHIAGGSMKDLSAGFYKFLGNFRNMMRPQVFGEWSTKPTTAPPSATERSAVIPDLQYASVLGINFISSMLFSRSEQIWGFFLLITFSPRSHSS